MKRIFLITIIVVLTGVLLVSTYFIADYLLGSHEQRSIYNDLSELVEIEIEETTKTEDSSTECTAIEESKAEIVDVTIDFAELNSINSDSVGWIRVPDTNINYPVVQAVGDNDYYLTHNFYGQYSVYGCPFVQENCSVDTPSDNIIIYAHNMNDGSMFAGLLNYTDYNFYEEHKHLEFITATESNSYEIISVFNTIAETGFRFYGFVNADSKNDFDEFVVTSKQLSFYDTGVSAEYGDELITLATCEYSNPDSRLVVVAKKV